VQATITVWVKRMDLEGARYAGYKGAESTWTVDDLCANLVPNLEYGVPAHLVTLKLAGIGEEEPTKEQELVARGLRPRWKLGTLNAKQELVGGHGMDTEDWKVVWLLAVWPTVPPPTVQVAAAPQVRAAFGITGPCKSPRRHALPAASGRGVLLRLPARHCQSAPPAGCLALSTLPVPLHSPSCSGLPA